MFKFSIDSFRFYRKVDGAAFPKISSFEIWRVPYWIPTESISGHFHGVRLGQKNHSPLLVKLFSYLKFTKKILLRLNVIVIEENRNLKKKRKINSLSDFSFSLWVFSILLGASNLAKQNEEHTHHMCMHFCDQCLCIWLFIGSVWSGEEKEHNYSVTNNAVEAHIHLHSSRSLHSLEYIVKANAIH